jgi:rhamnosyl/mannosyltransferase
MKILHIYKDYHPVVGGIENHIRALAEAQAQHGHEVTVLVTSPGPHTLRETLNGVQVIKAGRVATVASTPLSWALPRLLRELAPDITHLQAPYPLGEIAQVLAGHAPYVVSYQADVNRLAQRLIMLGYGPVFQRFLDGAARILASSRNFALHSPYLTPAHQAKLSLVPIGCDPRRFTPAPAPAQRPRPVMLFMGVLRHYKGVDDAIRALLFVPEAELWIGGSGPMRAAWENLARALGVAPRVKFLGRVSDDHLPALYRSADIFVLPSTSRAESYGTVLVEAMAAGLPCVTTEIGSGNSFIVQDQVTGFVVRPRAPAHLATALNQLVADPNLRWRMGGAGRERVLQNFTVEKMISRVETVYAEARQSP